MTPQINLSAAKPPGEVIYHENPNARKYIGSPSLAVLPDGRYVASHDCFGPGSTEFQSGETHIFRSEDRGQTWKSISRVEPAFWGNLFVHEDSLYLLSLSHHHGLLLMRRSEDGGETWTHPKDTATGLLTPHGQYHQGPMPMLVHRGRIWRAIEDATASTAWGLRYNPILISAPLGADLLRRDSWIFSSMPRQSNTWLEGRFGGWLEGNVVALPDGTVADILRVEYPPGGKAAMAVLGDDGHTLEFSPTTGFIELPGGSTKFAIRRDSTDGTYWTLSNAVPPLHASDKANHASIRNTVALLRSSDLRAWEIHDVPLYHPDSGHHAFQYLDWLFDGSDLIAVSRTAWPDCYGGAPNAHDANFLTFHRIEKFRNITRRAPPFAASF